MNITLKIIATLILVGICTFIFFLGMAPLIEGKHIIKPYIDTHFAADYSPEKFELVALGMSKEEIIELLGEPLYTGSGYDDSMITNYHYTGDGKLLNQRKPGEQLYDDYAWYRSTVGFDSTNTVVFIDKGWSYD